MKNYITRTDAASILGVHPQTITNYANDGYFDIIKTPSVVYVDKESFERFIENHSVAAKGNEEIRERIEAERKELTERLSDLEAEANNHFKVLSARNDYARSMGVWGFSMLAKLFDAPLVRLLDLDNAKTTWVEIFKSFASGNSKDTVCNTFGVSAYTLNNKMYRLLLIMRELPEKIESLLCERAELQRKVLLQREHIKQLQDEKKQLQVALKIKADKDAMPVDMKMMTYAMNIRVCDSDLSVRTLNHLRTLEVETLQDLTRVSERDLKMLRNCGRKTIVEIKEFLELHRQASGFDFQLKKIQV